MVKKLGLGLALAAFAGLGVPLAGAQTADRVQLAQGGGADINEAFKQLQAERQRQRAQRERLRRQQLEAERQAREAAQQQGQTPKQ